MMYLCVSQCTDCGLDPSLQWVYIGDVILVAYLKVHVLHQYKVLPWSLLQQYLPMVCLFTISSHIPPF